MRNGTDAGGDLYGVWPNPELGPNTVGSAKVSDGSLDLADVAEATLTQRIGGDTWLVPAHGCVKIEKTSPVVDPGDLVLADTPVVPQGWPFQIRIEQPIASAARVSGGTNFVAVGLCNDGDYSVQVPDNTILRLTIFDDGNDD